MKSVRVAVQAFDPITRAALESYLRPWPDLVVVERAELTEQDVLVVSVDRMTPRIADELGAAPAVRTVLLAGELRDNDIVALVECQVVAVLLRATTSGDELVATVRSVADGSGALPAALLGQLFDHVRRLQQELRPTGGIGGAGLTEREIVVLRLMADGRDTAEIAEELCYSERTVKNVIYALTTRLNLRNRPHAVAYAMRAGMI